MKLRVVEIFKEYYSDESHFSNFLAQRNIETDRFWFFDKRTGTMFQNKKQILIKELKCLYKIMSDLGGFRNRKVVCFGGHYSMMFVTRILGVLMGKDYHLYIYNFYLHKMGTRRIVKRMMRFLLQTKNITLIVQSPDEIKYFAELTKNQIYFIPYCENPGFRINNAVSVEGNYLFTGGYTNRDYSLIVECARSYPGLKFVLVVSRSNKDLSDGQDLPGNIVIYEELDIYAFNGLMSKALGVIIPLKENVGASGQMLCLGAMKQSKAIIYCDISSINFYFNGGQCGTCGIPYSLGQIDSLNKAVKSLVSGEIDPISMGKKAYEQFSGNFTLDKRNGKMLNIIQSI